MTDAPKLLTKQDLQYFATLTPIQQINYLGERNLIAPEPVCKGPHMDLTHMTRAQCAEWLSDATRNVENTRNRGITGYLAGWEPEIMRRAAEMLELAQPTLTREMVADAVFNSPGRSERYITNVHAALTGQKP